MKLRSLILMTLMPSLLLGQADFSFNDWPQWRGPDRQGIWYNGPEVDTLSPEIIQQAWSVEIGPGYNGPTVAEGRIYAMDYKKRIERVLCLNAVDGAELWSYGYPVTYSVGYPTGPRASVLIREGRAYSWGTMGHLYCFNAATGEIIWKKNTLESYDIRLPIWGLASNLLMVGDHLIVQLGGKSGGLPGGFSKRYG